MEIETGETEVPQTSNWDSVKWRQNETGIQYDIISVQLNQI